MKKREIHRDEDSRPERAAEVRNLYHVFSSYKIKVPLWGCPCCVSAESVAELHAKPLEKLERDILDTFTWSAALTWGELDDLKHFLPRILELTLAGDFDLWLLSLRLDALQWRDWPLEEVLAVRDFLHFAWRHFVQKEDSDLMGDWLELFSTLREPIIELLWMWADSPSARMRCRFAEWIARGQWQNEKIPDISEMFTPELTGKLETYFFENPNGPDAETFAQAVDLVRSLAVWKQNEN